MRRFKPISLAILLALLAVVAYVVVAATGTTLPSVNSSIPTVAAVFFPENGAIRINVEGGGVIRLGILTDSKQAVAVACPKNFEPDGIVYVAESYVLETEDGRLTPTVWVLRMDETTGPPANGQLIIEK